jgi:hypothetical protein
MERLIWEEGMIDERTRLATPMGIGPSATIRVDESRKPKNPN